MSYNIDRKVSAMIDRPDEGFLRYLSYIQALIAFNAYI